MKIEANEKGNLTLTQLGSEYARLDEGVSGRVYVFEEETVHDANRLKQIIRFFGQYEIGQKFNLKNKI